MLGSLNISANNLETLPAELLDMIRYGPLTELIADPNPWTQVPASATKQKESLPISCLEGASMILRAVSTVQLLKPSGAVDNSSAGHQDCHRPERPGTQATLAETALTKLIKLQAFPSIFASAIENVDGPILDVLKVGMNVSLLGDRHCTCGRSFILPRHQWMEWWDICPPWRVAQPSKLPFLRQVCRMCPSEIL